MNRKILFVDDEPAALKLYKQMLNGEFDIATALSGEDAIARQGVLDPTVAFIQKPYRPKALARKVQEVLAGTTSQTGEHAQSTLEIPPCVSANQNTQEETQQEKPNSHKCEREDRNGPGIDGHV